MAALVEFCNYARKTGQLFHYKEGYISIKDVFRIWSKDESNIIMTKDNINLMLREEDARKEFKEFTENDFITCYNYSDNPNFQKLIKSIAKTRKINLKSSLASHSFPVRDEQRTIVTTKSKGKAANLELKSKIMKYEEGKCHNIGGVLEGKGSRHEKIGRKLAMISQTSQGIINLCITIDKFVDKTEFNAVITEAFGNEANRIKAEIIRNGIDFVNVNENDQKIIFDGLRPTGTDDTSNEVPVAYNTNIQDEQIITTNPFRDFKQENISNELFFTEGILLQGNNQGSNPDSQYFVDISNLPAVVASRKWDYKFEMVSEDVARAQAHFWSSPQTLAFNLTSTDEKAINLFMGMFSRLHSSKDPNFNVKDLKKYIEEKIQSNDIVVNFNLKF
jgi:hypothetical protein